MRHRDLPERYVVISELGSGGMGSVYLVTDSVLNKHVAVKVLSKPVAEADPVSVRRFQREARAAGNLNHENIVKILDFGVNENEQPYLVMEHFDGVTLEDMVGKGGRLSLETALEIFSQVCRAISHTHENGIVHRDLKSSNILVRQDNTGTFQVKLIDFGIACFAEQTDTHSKVTTGNAILGSPLYMSPEQARGGTIDERSDIYSLGCVMFEALTGSVPLMGETALDTMSMQVSTAAPGLNQRLGQKIYSEQVEGLVARCLEKDPEVRFQGIEEVGEELRLIANSPVPESTPISPRRQVRLPVVLLGLVALSVALVSLTATFSGNLKSPAGSPPEKPVPDSGGRALIKGNQELMLGLKAMPGKELRRLLAEHPESVNVENAKVTNEIIDIIAASPLCKSADFRSSNIEDVSRLSALKSLHSICLDDSNFDRKGLMAIQSLSELRVFQAGHTIIENDDLKYLGGLQSLYKIQVDGTAISDESIAHLSRMDNLQELFIRDTRITAIGLNSLLKLRKLRKLDLSGCRKLSEAEVEAFRRARPDCTVFREQSLRWDQDDKGAVEDLL